MRIVQVGGSSVTSAARRRATDTNEPESPQSGTRALIAVEATQLSERSPNLSGRPGAPFLAQLIATQMQAPQTRLRRRAEPQEAIAVYRSMTKPAANRRSGGTRA